MIDRAKKCGIFRLLILLAVGFGGCGTKASFDTATARQRLAAVLKIQPEVTLDVLMHRQMDDTEHWILLSDSLLEPLQSDPSTAPRSRSATDRMPESKFPASALFSFAATFGVSHEVMNASAADEGIAREWSIDGRNVRLRSVETESGFLSVLEILP